MIYISLRSHKLAEDGENDSHPIFRSPLVSNQVRPPDRFIFHIKLADREGVQPPRVVSSEQFSKLWPPAIGLSIHIKSEKSRVTILHFSGIPSYLTAPSAHPFLELCGGGFYLLLDYLSIKYRNDRTRTCNLMLPKHAPYHWATFR